MGLPFGRLIYFMYLCSRNGRKASIHYRRAEWCREDDGIDNLFRIYMPIVDTWVLVDNSITPRNIIASGGMNQELLINNEVEFIKIEAYVKH